jgi:hypothetical protein
MEMEMSKEAQKMDASNAGKPFDLWGYSVADIAVQITICEFNLYRVNTITTYCVID